MAKWSKKYTTLENVNGGNEYETGDHITKETVNVALNNTAYLQQTKVTAESNKGLVTQRFLDGVDLNTVLANGFYGCNGACTNKPNENGPGQMLVINRGDNWIGQFYINMNQESKAFSNRVHTRGYDNSKKVWSPWKQIDNDPSLYNLGAYDTYVDNGDGTTTITRQTGYLNADISLKWDINATGSYGIQWLFNFPTTMKEAKANLPLSGNITPTSNTFAYGYSFNTTYNTFILCLPTRYNANTRTGLYEYLSKNPVSIEYKLATPYTETIITGVPQITLDKQGCEWLRSEWEKGLNLIQIEDVGSTTLNGITYSINNGVVTLNGTPTANLDIVLGTINLEQGNYTYRSFATLINGSLMTLATDINGNMDLLQQSNDIDYVSQVLTNDIYTFKLRISTSCPTLTNVTVKPMLVRGTKALPYAPYNGSIIHEKQLSLQAPSMGHKVANECMMNVTGEYYNNSSSDVYILLGNIKRSYKEARDGGFIINGTIGQYYYTQQAQINAVAYWRDKVKWKGSYTQDNSDGNFNNIVDLIITTTNKIYLVIKAGQFGQYNLQLQGVTIQYTGNILTAKEGSTASMFSQSEAIDLTALNNNANRTITDSDVDTSNSMQGTYTPFDVEGDGPTYADQSEVNTDFYKAIRALRNRNLYHTTITHGYNTTSYGQNTGEFFEVTIFTSDDKTGYNTAGTAWTILRDYLNNNDYTLGNVANWITSNQVYPCNGQLLKYSSSVSVSLTYNIYGVSYNNGKFYVHYYTNTNAHGTSELPHPDSYWRVKSTKIF